MEIPKMIPIDELRRLRKEEADPNVTKRSQRLRTGVKSAYDKEAEYQKKRAGEHAGKADCLVLKGISGVYDDAYFPLDLAITIGREVGEANILYPSDTPGISRKHCRIWMDDNGTVLIKDLGSSQGTFFYDGTRLTPDKTYRLRTGEIFYLASPKQAFRILKQETNV